MTRTRVAIALFVAFAAFDLWWIAHRLPREEFGDEWRYLLYADNLLHGFFSPRGRVFLHNGPGYPLVLAPFVAAHWTDGARYLNAFLHAGAIVYAWRILSSRLSLRGAALALFPLAIYPPIFVHLPLLYTETLTFFLVIAWIHHALAARERPRHWIVAGALLGFLALTKVVFGLILEVFLVGLCLLWLIRRSPTVLAWLKQASLAFALCIPFLVYTFSLTGKPFYWASLGANSFYWLTSPYPGELGDWYHQGWVAHDPILSAHHKAIYDRAIGLSENPNLSDRELVYRLTTPESDKIFLEAALQNVRAHPAKFALNWCANLSRLFFDMPTSVRGTPFWNVYTAGNLPLLIGMLGVPLWGWRRRIGPPPEWWPIAAFGLLSLGVYSFASIVSRFFIPLAPMLWLPACVWSASLWPRRGDVARPASSSASSPAAPGDA
jgi:hypothetical protein